MRAHTRTPKVPVESRSYRALFVALAAANMAAAAWVVFDESSTRRPWKSYQQRFAQLGARRGKGRPPSGLVQVTNPEIGLADRCMSCHLAIDRPGFEGNSVPAVLRTHPRRAVLLGKRHPVQRIGCTTCHEGQGTQTKGVARDSFDHGRRDPSWERPLLSRDFIQSTCVGCHQREQTIPEADLYNRGRWLFEDRRCFGCHATEHKPGFAAAPALDHLRSKTSRAVVEAWLVDPPRYRSRARMPAFWPAPVEASSGRPYAAGSPQHAAWAEARDRDVKAIAAYLGSLSPRTPFPEVTAAELSAIASRDPKPGRILFGKIGCRGCHAIESTPPSDQPNASFGPNLARVGELVSPRWLLAWLRRPRAVWPGTRMPDLRLTDDERQTLVAFLVTLRQDKAAPMALGPEWPDAHPSEIEAGRRAFRKYGCFGCHEVPKQEQIANRAGPEITELGDRTPDHLEWGDAKVACSGTPLECWIQQKLQSPRRMRRKTVDLVMPDQALTAEEVRALSVFLLGQRKHTIPAQYHRRLSPAQEALAAGERIIVERNCRGCHEIGRREEKGGENVIPIGGDIRRYFEDPALAPPPLTFAGKKFQFPWVYGFLTAPTRIRPWLVGRMPTFSLTEDEKQQLIHYFAARDGQPYPFQLAEVEGPAAKDCADAQWLFQKLQCIKCHQISSAKKLKTGELAPDLARTASRLKRGWLREWLLNPQRLQPGTKMPTYFPLADDDDPKSFTTPFADRLGGDVRRQVEALVGLNMELGRPAGHDEVPGEGDHARCLKKGKLP